MNNINIKIPPISLQTSGYRFQTTIFRHIYSYIQNPNSIVVTLIIITISEQMRVVTISEQIKYTQKSDYRQYKPVKS